METLYLYPSSGRVRQCNGPALSEGEGKALAFITSAIGRGKSPSVRAIAAELGLSSSRSGQRMVDSLMAKGVITRNDQGSLALDRDTKISSPI